jgi:hypothetical protein
MATARGGQDGGGRSSPPRQLTLDAGEAREHATTAFTVAVQTVGGVAPPRLLLLEPARIQQLGHPPAHRGGRQGQHPVEAADADG